MRLYILAVVIGLALRRSSRDGSPSCCRLRDVFLFCLVPFLRTRGYSALPVHFLGKAATADLLCAFPLLLLGDGGEPWRPWPGVRGGPSRSGAGLYWWAGFLYAYQVVKLLRMPRDAVESVP